VLKGPWRGLPLSAEGLDEILDGARRRAGLEHATCHQLRHTCLTRLREAGMALEAVQAQAGHRSIESTRVYLKARELHLPGEVREVCPGTQGVQRPADSPFHSFMTWDYPAASPPDARSARYPGKITRAGRPRGGPVGPSKASAGPWRQPAGLAISRP